MLKKLSLTTIATLSLTFLVGCQTAPLSKSANQNSASPTFKNMSLNAVSPQQLLERLTYYDWQLIQVKSATGKTKPFRHDPPLLMDVTPNSLMFSEGCYRYQVFLSDVLGRTYLYSFNNFRTLEALPALICQNSGTDDSSEIRSTLERLFVPYGDVGFNFEVLSASQPQPKIALSINNGAALIFSGKAKPQQSVSGIPITHELLQRYNWRLIRATDANQNLIDDFHQPDIPITASFFTDEYRQQFGVSVGQHGSGGSYVLSVNQTLLTQTDPSIAISFGERLDNIWRKFVVVALKPSQLILTEQQAPSQNSNQTSPRYLLTQRVESGETLVWENEVKNH
ncbi:MULTISPECIES: hypothetical protein [Psychrobacter]|uniref:hypothetical protein n=1 Tax=Psychrobacter TaxID=497 RepID=UPI00146D805C|nr:MULTISPECIES: hypothetical protein [Psychrobacter]